MTMPDIHRSGEQPSQPIEERIAAVMTKSLSRLVLCKGLASEVSNIIVPPFCIKTLGMPSMIDAESLGEVIDGLDRATHLYKRYAHIVHHNGHTAHTAEYIATVDDERLDRRVSSDALSRWVPDEMPLSERPPVLDDYFRSQLAPTEIRRLQKRTEQEMVLAVSALAYHKEHGQEDGGAGWVQHVLQLQEKARLQQDLPPFSPLQQQGIQAGLTGIRNLFGQFSRPQ